MEIGSRRPASRVHYMAVPALVVLSTGIVASKLATAYAPEYPHRLIWPLSIQLAYDPGNILRHTPSPLWVVALTHLLMLVVLLSLFIVLKTRLAAVAVGLSIGGVLGNGMALLLSPHQVVDFLIIGGREVFNIYDLAASVGILFLAWKTTSFVITKYREHYKVAPSTVSPGPRVGP
jgi:lipoprotein signal peptidase